MGKRCTRCLQWKPRSEFYRDGTKRDGLKSQCKECGKLYKREYRARLRTLALVRLKRTYKQAWLPRLKPIIPTMLDEGLARWMAKNQARRRAYLAASLRRWHAANPAASRTWYDGAPEIPLALRQARRADVASVAVNDLSPDEWKWLLDTFEHRCAYCGQPGDRLTPDHVTPLSQGGHNTLSNIVPACRTCNVRKGARTPEEARMGFVVHVNVIHHLEQIALI
jgi:5-methylcytosine-specific restriction endonuclease McrA